MIITNNFSSSKSMQAWLEETETQQMYDMTCIDWATNTIRYETKAALKVD